jgi:hypothetical protein
MRGNSSHTLMNLKKQIDTNTINSFFFSNQNYGFESESVTLDELLKEFKVEDDLRKRLKDTKVKLKYKEIDSIDLGTATVFEIGRTTITVNDSSASVLRLRQK